MKKFLIAVTVIFITLSSCQKDFKDYIFSGSAKPDHSTDDNTYHGQQVQMGQGMARSWITITKKGVPQEIGIEMTDKVLSGLPDANFNVVLPLHVKAKETTPFDHLYVTWSAHGHPLPGTAIGPHFDVRFFMTSLENHLSIPAPPAPGFTNLPPAGYMPENYFPDASIPGLGLHWTDKTFANPVASTMILGSYDGAFTFVSPIVVAGVLQTGQSFSIPYAQPQNFAKHSWYPAKYNVYTNTSTHKRYVTLSEFAWR